MRAKYPGKKRYVTTEDGRVTEWKWGSNQVPLYTRCWTVESMDRWHQLDNDDRVSVRAREYVIQAAKVKAPKRGNKKADVDPRSL